MYVMEHPEYIPKRKDKALVTNLCPGFDRQFRDLNGGGINDGHLSTVHELVVHHLLNCASEAFVVWKLKEKKKHPHHLICTQDGNLRKQQQPFPVLTMGSGSSPLSIRWMLVTISRMS